MPYRLEGITLQERVKLSCRLVAHQGEYGLVARLAREHGVSRRFLYELRDRTQAAAQAELALRVAGRKRVDKRLGVDELRVSRAILVLNQVAHASVRGIAECLGEILEVPRSIGSIHKVLKEGARRARALARAVPQKPVKAVCDEVYAADKPVLEVVDHRSGLILALEPVQSVDETTWGCQLLELEALGVEIERLVADGGKALRAGARAIGRAEPYRDHWHSLRGLFKVQSYLENEAYRRLRAAEKLREEAGVRERQRTNGGRRCRMGRPFKVGATDPGSVEAAQQAAREAIVRYDAVSYLLEVARDVLEPVDARTGKIRQARWVREELQAAAQLLRESGGRAVSAAKLLAKHVPALVAYLVQLELELAPLRAQLGEESLSRLAWEWRHREALGASVSSELASQVWRVLSDAVRASGMAENLGSLLAAHRASHKSLTDNLLSVFVVYRNHHAFERGERAPHSPLQLAGLPSPHWLDALGYGRTPTAPDPVPLPLHPVQFVTTIAA